MALFLAMAPAWEGALAQMVCSDCRQPITGQYVRWGSQAFHPQHFACAACSRPISGSYATHQGRPYHDACYNERFGLKCGVCAQSISGKYVPHQGKAFHPACYTEHLAEKCAVCARPLTGKYVKHEGSSYHTACFQANVAPKCDVCGAGMVGKYLVDPMGNRYHAEHRIPLCTYCRRVISPQTSRGGYTYSDGRSVCALCYPTVVRKDHEAASLVEQVRSELESLGIEVPASAAPLQLVDLTTLKRHVKRGGLHGQNVQGFTSVVTETRNGQVSRHEIAVYVLDGMPREDFMGTVAHELMHVWINLNAGKKLHPALEEGACNYVRALVHEAHGSEEAARNLKSMADDPDEHYGRGYRRARAYAERNGLPALLMLLRKGSAFPLGY